MAAQAGSSHSPDSAFVCVELPGETAGEPSRQLLVARFPSTVREFGEFIEAGGYQDPRWWSDRGWDWRRLHEIRLPTYWGDKRYSKADFPVTGVSFWEADAYARFRGAALPTEHEWYIFASNGSGTRFPWGKDEPSSRHANLGFVLEFGQPTRVVPVSATVQSSSSAGVRDLIGNVAEWCLPYDRCEIHDEVVGVLRGAASWHAPGAADSSFRDEVPMSVRDNQTGIRLVRRPQAHTSLKVKPPIGWPSLPRPLGRAMNRPTRPFRQERIPSGLSEKTWRLKVLGVPKPREFTLNDLRNSFETTTSDGLFVCVCRWGAINRVSGVLLADVLESCGVPVYNLRDWQRYLRQRSVKGPVDLIYETTVPLAEAIEHKALLVYAMDDSKTLTEELGFPLRYIDFHQYGYKNVKCLSELIITDEFQRGLWEDKCQYDIDGTILPGTVTIVGPEAMRVDIPKRGRVEVPASWKAGWK